MMEISNAASSRSDFYDRNPLIILLDYNMINIAPHGVTVRDTYTVPANRLAIVNYMQVAIGTITLGAPSARADATISIVPFGLATGNIMVMSIFSRTLYEQVSISGSPGFVLSPGDKIDLLSRDVSVGGLKWYGLGAALTEYDF